MTQLVWKFITNSIMLQKNMKQLVLESSSISLWLKNEPKIPPLMEIHEKGGSALRCTISKPLTSWYGVWCACRC